MSQALLPAAAGTPWTGMSGLDRIPGYVVMQPTTLCNLDCAYCYLPDRAVHRPMDPAVAAAVAGPVNRWAAQRPGFAVVWHGGEPLAAGRDAFARLLSPFSDSVEHQVQTNATLVNDSWCELFREHRVRVSISVDGPEPRNDARRNRAHRPAYDMIMHGVEALRRNGVDFAALCVVSDPRPGQATELYRYFAELGCRSIGINIEEHEGVNGRSTSYADGSVRAFWAELAAAWRADPRLAVREIDWSLSYLRAALDGTAAGLLPRRIDPIPSIGHDGSVIVLSPELAGFSHPRYGDFTCGNVLDRSLEDILAAARGTGWVAEYLGGVAACRDTCAYFGFCGGGPAGNRFFEHGSFAVTETNHCRNSRIRLLDGVLDHAQETIPVVASDPGPAARQPEARAAAWQAGTPADPLAARIGRLAAALGPLLTAGAPGCAFYNWNNRPR